MRNTLLSKNAFRSLFWCFALLLLLLPVKGWGQYSGTGTFNKITSVTELTDGYYVVAYGTTFAMNNTNAGTFFANTGITPSSNSITNPASTIVWKIQSHIDGGRTIYNEATAKYVSYTGSSNASYAVASVTGGSERWSFAWATSVFTVANVTLATRLLQYNTGSPRFACYTGSQQNITLYKMAVSGSASPTLTADATSNTVDNPIDITFTDDSAWRTVVTAVKIGTTTLASGTDYDFTAGNLQLKPSGLNALLTTSGSKSVTIVAAGYTDATITQVINAGAPTTNSTATISAALTQNTTRTVTCTAKDQYNNLVSGYTFAYDITITNNDNTTSESYTIDSSPFAATSTSGNLVVATTNASGVATFTAVLPATIDANDGISIQVQLNDDTTTIGSAFSFTQLASQTITFNALSPVTYGDAAFGLTATASSTLPVTYTSSNTAVATISGSAVTIVSAGSTNITASQAGNGSYNAASNVIQSLTVNARALTLPDAAATSKVYTGTNVAVITGTLTGIINSDDVTLIGTGTFADVNVANGIAVTSTSTLGGTKAGNYALTQPTGLMADITQATQTITFGALANRVIGAAPFNLTLNASSGLSISYASSNTAVATISGNTVTIVGLGTTTITASQAGDNNYSAATDVIQTLTVTPAPIAAWDFTGVGSVTNTTVAATTFSTDLVATAGANDISRGATAGWSTGSNSFRTVGFKNEGISTANTDYFQITIQASAGKIVSLSTIDANFAGTAGFYNTGAGVSNQFAYSLDGTNFTLIGTPNMLSATPLTISQIDLSTVTALQNVASGTTITLRYYASGQTTTGGWGFTSASAGTNGLAIGGTTSLITDTTWNGTSWSNGAPSASIDAIIAGVYSTTSNGAFTAQKVIVNSGSLTINSGTTVTIQNELINNLTAADVVVENNANLIQVNTIANTGNITVNRNSSALFRLDYTMWSAPVTGSQSLLNFSPLTSAGRYYEYNTGANQFIAVASSSAFALAKGYLIRMPNTWTPFPGTPAPWTGTFTGIPNNGDITFGMSNALNGYNAVGNPYPSALDLDTFITGNNSNIEGTLWFWRKTNDALNPNSYSTCTTVGCTLPNGNSYTDANLISVGQGFIVQAKVGQSTLNFTNSTMRSSQNVDQFFRSAATDRYWLALKNSNNVSFGQKLIAYVPQATLGYDNGLDGLFINDSQTALLSMANNREVVIQARPTFDITDVVPMVFKTNVADTYAISLQQVEGLFEGTGSQVIYLKDNLTNTTHNLSTGNYTFATAAGVFNTRFEIVYQNLLSVDLPTFNENSVVLYKANGAIHINAGVAIMDNVKIFDISGRLLAEKSKVNASETTLDCSKFGTQVLIVQITSDTQIKVSKKVVN